MVGGVGTEPRNGNAGFMRKRSHAVGDVPHITQTHLRQIIEAIVVYDEELRSVPAKSVVKRKFVMIELNIVYRDIDTVFTENRGGIQSPQRRIRHHRPLFLGVEV